MQNDFSLESYDYTLPKKNIAQHPALRRDESKLLVLDHRSNAIEHKQFYNIIDYFKENDILVVNNTKVFPARLQGKKDSGGKAEIFLLHLPEENLAQLGETTRRCADTLALIKSSRKPVIGSRLYVSPELSCQVLAHLDNGQVKVRLEYPNQKKLADILQDSGSVPLPPYIERKDGTTENDRNRYQTVYAEHTGAVAAPTAGLHFTQPILDSLRERDVAIASLTLHVGYGTFAPVRTEEIKRHNIHREYLTIGRETAEKINRAKQNGGKVWAVGTTTVRALEFAATENGNVKATDGWCDLYIIPGYRFKAVDNLITNFHLPKSSLLFLVSALCGRETLLNCYAEAIAKDYRFYSYGDAMAVIGR